MSLGLYFSVGRVMTSVQRFIPKRFQTKTHETFLDATIKCYLNPQEENGKYTPEVMQQSYRITPITSPIDDQINSPPQHYRFVL